MVVVVAVDGCGEVLLIDVSWSGGVGCEARMEVTVVSGWSSSAASKESWSYTRIRVPFRPASWSGRDNVYPGEFSGWSGLSSSDLMWWKVEAATRRWGSCLRMRGSCSLVS